MVGDIVAGNQRTTHWRSTYPINLYNITVNIGDYVHFGETMQRGDGSVLKIDYYPLLENLNAAKKQFRQTLPMLRCFESAFGRYPCSNDGFSVVETPYAGMEHQGAVAYGNGYRDGYRGEDYSGIGLGFDFILIHESAHEWWGNAVTAASPADFWMQEAFCTYAEMQYVACRFSASKALAYIQAKRRLVSNRAPMYGNSESGVDMYAKGALMLHSMSLMLPQRSDFIALLRSFIKAYTHTPVTTEALCTWFEQRIPGLKPEFFTQFLKHSEIPLLEMREAPGKPGQTEVRFTRCVAGFAMPIGWKGKRIGTFWVSTEWTLLPKNVQPNHLRSATLTSYFEFS
jgi:aminopeptidase N